jgi:outer membrane protein OmpA-like peptidoglycan-associated protein
VALQRQEQEFAEHQQTLARERESMARERESMAREQAQASEARRAQAEDARRAEEARRKRAEDEKRASDQARADAERARVEADRAAERLAQERRAADEARAAAEAARVAAEAQTQSTAAQAQQAAEQAEREKTELRERLREQLNVILETRETARGLIVNLSDVLFDTGSTNLRPGAREKLAKIAGILLAHPGLEVQVEGHTDSVGSESYNQRLSEGRASAVHDYLVRQGIPPAVVGTSGFGEDRPVATNGTSAGRQQNRRVELVVSGAPIGRGR